LIIGTWYNQSLVVKGARDAFPHQANRRPVSAGRAWWRCCRWRAAGTTTSWLWAALQDPASLPASFQLILLALVAGPMGKCAQIPLHLWLDEAMEGPLPSTILRNSVVVAGGAWVLLRLQPLMAISPWPRPSWWWWAAPPPWPAR
jgi:NAD(P)H-quinone oxidoreductase subunit 5